MTFDLNQLSGLSQEEIAARLEQMTPEQLALLDQHLVGAFSAYQERPVDYAREVLKVEPTPAQIDILEHLHKPPYKVLVPSGHDVGKCVAKDELITLANGQRIPAKDLVGKNFHLMTLIDGTPASTLARAEWNLIEPVYRVTTDSGRTIARNGKHPLWSGFAHMKTSSSRKRGVTSTGWKALTDFKVGDLVAVTEKLPVFGNESLPDAEIKSLAYLIGDGGFTGYGVIFSQQENKQLVELSECVRSLGGDITKSKHGKYDYRITSMTTSPRRWSQCKDYRRISHRANPIKDLLKKHGLDRKHSRQKRVPEIIFQLPEEKIILFLSRLYATDGWASISNTSTICPNLEIGFCSASKGLCQDVQDLLVRMGIRSCLTRRELVNAWCVSIRDAEEVVKFCDRIGIYGKEEAVEKIRTRAELRVNSPKLKRWRKKNAPGGTFWERVVSVECIGEEMTVAIEVPEHHTYLTQFWEHNTFTGAVAVNYWWDVYETGVIISTAPTSRDVKDLLWAEIRLQRQRAGLSMPFPGPSAPEMQEDPPNPEHWGKGYTAGKGEGYQGRHRRRMLFVLDEANGIEPPAWRGYKTMFDPSLGHAMLVFFNPTSTTSQAYQEDTLDDLDGTQRWHRFRLSAAEHPNIRAEWEGKPKPVPGAVSLAMLEGWIHDWTEPVAEGEERATDFAWPPLDFPLKEGKPRRWYRPGPEFQARVLGVWPDTGDGVWSPALWLACNDPLRTPELPPPGGILPEIGCDTSTGKGEDFMSIHGRWGKASIHHETSNTMDAVVIASRLRSVAEKLADMANAYRHPNEQQVTPQKIHIKIDDDGTGGAVYAILSREGYMISPVGASTKALQESKYPNKRSELWFQNANKAREGLMHFGRLDRETKNRLKQQLMAPAWDLDYAGRRKVEPKDDTKEKIGRSPDDADAMNLAYYEGLVYRGPTAYSHADAEEEAKKDHRETGRVDKTAEAHFGRRSMKGTPWERRGIRNTPWRRKRLR